MDLQGTRSSTFRFSAAQFLSPAIFSIFVSFRGWVWGKIMQPCMCRACRRSGRYFLALVSAHRWTRCDARKNLARFFRASQRVHRCAETRARKYRPDRRHARHMQGCMILPQTQPLNDTKIEKMAGLKNWAAENRKVELRVPCKSI